MTDPDISRALGEELRRTRASLGMSRAELVKRLPDEIHVQTLAAYERGVRQCTVRRLVEICRVLGVAAPEVLCLALQRGHAEEDLRASGLHVDLNAVLADRQPALRQLRRWARNRVADDQHGTGVARLDWAVVKELATLLGVSQRELVGRLIAFTPHGARQFRPQG